MTNLLKSPAEANAEFYREQQRRKDDQALQVKLLVDQWMQDEAMVENAMLKAINEVSGDVSLALAESEQLEGRLPFAAHAFKTKAIVLLVDQIRKELEEQAEDHLYG